MRDPGLDPQTYETSWKLRRRAVFGTLAFCAAGIVYLLIWGEDTRLNETIANGLMLVGGSVVLGYCGFAAMDDRSKRSSYVAYRSTVLTKTGRVDDPDAG